MATVTKTIKENDTTITSPKNATWNFSLTGTDTTITGDTFTFSPTLTAKMTYSGKNYAGCTFGFYMKATGSNSNSYQPSFWLGASSLSSIEYTSWASGATKTVPLRSTSTVQTSYIFNDGNKNTRTVDLVASTYALSLASCKGSDYSDMCGYYDQSVSELAWGTIATLTLDAPPNLSTITSTSTSNSAGYYWKDISSAYVNVTASQIKYGGGVAEATLTIGEQTRTITYAGKVSIPVNTTGTFTPTLTVTDTRGQTTTKSLANITVQEYQSPTITWGTIQSDTTGFYAGQSTVSLTLSNISIMGGFNFSSAVLTIGSQTQTVTTMTGNSVSFSLPLDVTNIGTFTPSVKFTTTAGVYTTHDYSSIIISEYTEPAINFTVVRSDVNHAGKPDDEGTNALVTATITYDDNLDLAQPTVTVTDDSGTPQSAVITWYTTWNASTGVSNAVNWTSYSPTSPATIYGVITGYGSTTGIDIANAFQIAVTPKDEVGSGTAITQGLSISFFTIDFQAGGKEITFGGPANDANVETNHPNGLFRCDMDAVFTGLVGEIKMWAGNNAPNGWLVCDGTAISRTAYPLLFDAIGTLWGAGDGSTTFNLPNLVGRVPVGYDSNDTDFDTVGETGGTKDAIVPYHTHTQNAHYHRPRAGSAYAFFTGNATNVTRTRYENGSNGKYTFQGAQGDLINTGTDNAKMTGNETATNQYAGTEGNEVGANLQPYAVVKYIICAI